VKVPGHVALAALQHSSHEPLKTLIVAPCGAVKVHLALPEVPVVVLGLPSQFWMGAAIPPQMASSAIS